MDSTTLSSHLEAHGSFSPDRLVPPPVEVLQGAHVDHPPSSSMLLFSKCSRVERHDHHGMIQVHSRADHRCHWDFLAGDTDDWGELASVQS